MICCCSLLLVVDNSGQKSGPSNVVLMIGLGCGMLILVIAVVGLFIRMSRMARQAGTKGNTGDASKVKVKVEMQELGVTNDAVKGDQTYA